MELVHFRSDNPDVNVAYYTAMSDLIANIKPYYGGILPEEKEVIIAGIGYYTPWTRDASINTLNAGDYLFPEISKNTLESVLKEENGKLYIGGEYWDAIIWAWGAWEYYRYTKDADFLKKAYEAAVNSLAFLKQPNLTPRRTCSAARPATATVLLPILIFTQFPAIPALSRLRGNVKICVQSRAWACP